MIKVISARPWLEECVGEEGEAGILRWWAFPFAGLLIAAEWNVLSEIAATAAILSWPLSVMYLRAARARLAALQPPVGNSPEGRGE